MPDQQYGQKQTHGGDDTGDEMPPPAEAKKPSLGKYAFAPDVNIRDIFWKIMDEYAARKGKEVDVGRYTGMRTALVRIACSVLKNPESAYHGLSLNLTAQYTLAMVLDGQWEDMFVVLLGENAGSSKKIRSRLIRGFEKLLVQEKYRTRITEYFQHAIKKGENAGPMLLCIAEIEDSTLVDALKKWILVIAQTDIETNQIYAISALAIRKDDPEVKQLFIRLLSHWDPQTRKAIAAFLGKRTDAETAAAAQRQLPLETDPEVKKLLEKIVKAKKT